MEPIAIISHGGLFPDANNPEDFFTNLVAGRSSIKNLKKDIHAGNLINEFEPFWENENLSQDVPVYANTTYSYHGSFINRHELKKIAKKHNINIEEHTSTEIIAIEAAYQNFEHLKSQINFEKTDIILGCTSADNEYIHRLQERILSEKANLNSNDPAYIQIVAQLEKLKVPSEKYNIATSLLNIIQKKYNTQGLHTLVDAACASSLAAIHTAQNRLRLGQADFVLSGGIDINLAPFFLVMFSKLGVLAPFKMKPFNYNSKGMNPGEAAAMVLLCRLETAKKLKLPILGIIKNCDGSSDGSKGSATEPTEAGQILAYSRTISDEDAENVDYIESHGTGTVIGDRTELGSLNRFYVKNKKAYIGTVKNNVGHTIGAAGTVSLIKSLHILKTQIIPPHIDFERLPSGIQNQFLINTEVVKDQKIRNIVISSFGFGGTNFHMHLVHSDYINQTKKIQKVVQYSPTVLNAELYIDLSEIDDLLSRSKTRIPPKTVINFDKTVLAGFLGLEKLFNDEKIFLSDELKKKTMCLSTGAMPLTKPLDLMLNLACEALLCKSMPSEIADRIRTYQSTLPNFNEDTGPGTLNNLIAGRTSKVHNMQGLNFHIDADFASEGAGLIIAANYAQSHQATAIVIHSVEKYNTAKHSYDRLGVKVQIISTVDTSLKYNLPIKKYLSLKLNDREINL